MSETSMAVSTFIDSVRRSCGDRHAELDELVAWARGHGEANEVVLAATSSHATSVLKLIIPGERSALATVNHDITGEHVYVKIWRSQVERNAPSWLDGLERATRRPLGVGNECRAPFADVTEVLSSLFRSVADRRSERTTTRRSGTKSPRTRRPRLDQHHKAVRVVPSETRITEVFEVATVREQREALRRESALLENFERHLASRNVSFARLAIPVKGATLLTDLYLLPPPNQLIEAKGDVSRESVRMVVGQILDYLNEIDRASSTELEARPQPMILLPEHPGESLAALLEALGIGLVWQTHDGDFVEASGMPFP